VQEAGFPSAAADKSGMFINNISWFPYIACTVDPLLGPSAFGIAKLHECWYAL